MTVLKQGGIYRAHIPSAVALAWLTEQQRAEIRAKLPVGSRGSDAQVKPLIERYNVWGWAIAHVAATTEEDLVVLDVKSLSSWAGREVRRIENASIDTYKTFLVEYSRPPSKGGNTSAMHAHTIWIGEMKFSFWARGSRRFVFKEDTVSFDYVETDGGYLNIVPQSIICRDGEGKIQRRGDRRSKFKLRSTPARLPASRREILS